MDRRRRDSRKWKMAGSGWWDRTPLKEFGLVLSFANADISEGNFEALLWQVMGSERLYRVTVQGEERLCRPDDLAYVAMETLWGSNDTASRISHLPASWLPGRGFIPEADVIRAMNELAAVHFIPKLFGEPPTAYRALALRAKVRTILQLLVERAAARADRDDVLSELQGIQEMRNAIRRDFSFPDWRAAKVHADAGFIEFDDHGEDAARTVAWMLAGLTEVAFREDRGSIKRCGFCEGYFIHSTLRRKEFCRDECRINFHNKGLA